MVSGSPGIFKWNATAFFVTLGSSVFFSCPQGLRRIFGILIGQQPPFLRVLLSFTLFELKMFFLSDQVTYITPSLISVTTVLNDKCQFDNIAKVWFRGGVNCPHPITYITPVPPYISVWRHWFTPLQTEKCVVATSLNFSLVQWIL